MKTIDRFTIDHKQMDVPQLHGDLNKLVTRLNENFNEHNSQIALNKATIATQASLIADLQKRLADAGL